MTYPISLSLAAPAIGFAVANDEAEHQALTASGYGPAYVVPEKSDAEHTPESARAALDAAGIAYDKRLGLSKLIALLPA